jgi:hypothetical protein
MNRLPVNVNDVKELWFEDGSYVMGFAKAKTVEKVMEDLGIKFTDTSKGRELRNKFYQLLNRASTSFYNDGFYFGSIKLMKGQPKVYGLAKEPQEYEALDERIRKSGVAIAEKRQKSRLLIQAHLGSFDAYGKDRLIKQIAKK